MMSITLDKQQEMCVYTEKDHVLVIAAAGSGKTRVLTERVKYLIEEKGVSPSSIVAITFTNLAAEEMRERLEDVHGIGSAFIGTIHSFANRLMKDSGIAYKLLTEELSLQYYQYLINRYCKFLTVDRYVGYLELKKDVTLGKEDESSLHEYFDLSELSDLNNIRRSPSQVYEDLVQYAKDPVGDPPASDSIYTLYQKNNIISFDELIEKAKKYFESIDGKLEYLLVDEFQDVGHLEYSFFLGLNSTHTFYVGDDYQSIYGFKGGDVNIFKKLVNDTKYTKYYLTNNYRNGTSILDMADTVISSVSDRIKKDINSLSGKAGSVVVRNRKDIMTILRSIPSEDYSECFLLARSNKDLYYLSTLCDSLNIPYITFKREGLTLKDLRSLLSSSSLKLLTVHTSKGLEADNVILYGNFPIQKPSWIRDTEERKVMYVGVTRAKNKLIILN